MDLDAREQRTDGSDLQASDPGLRLVFVDESELRYWVPRAARHLGSIIKNSRGRLSPQYIGQELEAGRFWLALAVNGEAVRAAMLLQKINWPTGLNELVLMLAGDGMEEWVAFYPELERRAKRLGFHVLCDAGGRRGLGRLLAKIGWRETGSIYEKVIANVHT